MNLYVLIKFIMASEKNNNDVSNKDSNSSSNEIAIAHTPPENQVLFEHFKLDPGLKLQHTLKTPCGRVWYGGLQFININVKFQLIYAKINDEKVRKLDITSKIDDELKIIAQNVWDNRNVDVDSPDFEKIWKKLHYGSKNTNQLYHSICNFFKCDQFNNIKKNESEFKKIFMKYYYKGYDAAQQEFDPLPINFYNLLDKQTDIEFYLLLKYPNNLTIKTHIYALKKSMDTKFVVNIESKDCGTIGENGFKSPDQFSDYEFYQHIADKLDIFYFLLIFIFLLEMYYFIITMNSKSIR